MAVNILMPKLGLTMTEGTIEAWHKKVGDAVSVGDLLFSITTDKLTNDICSDVQGILLDVLVEAGTTVPCSTVVAIIGEENEQFDYNKGVALTTQDGEIVADVIVVGGGPGGYVAAIRAAQLGAKVILVEQEHLGGACLNIGYIPTKVLLHWADIIEEMHRGLKLSILSRDLQIDRRQMLDYQYSISEKLSKGIEYLMSVNNITVFQGHASFLESHKITVKTLNSERVIQAKQIIIATGSIPSMPLIPGLEENCVDSTNVLFLNYIPKTMTIIGGGVIGIELASAYSRLGTKITVLEQQSHILPTMDAEMSQILQDKMEKDGVEFLLSTQVLSVERCNEGIQVVAKRAEITTNILSEIVLVATGRRANIDSLHLERAGIQTQRGYISVDNQMRTNVPGIYAVGDCVGKVMLAHTASTMGEVAAENAVGHGAIYDPTSIPLCVYVSPEFASVGMTEEEVQSRGIDYVVGKFPLSANGKSLVLGQEVGMAKILADRKYQEVLGVHLLAPRATDLIAQAALAIQLEATLDELVNTIYAHPTVSEAVREAALAAQRRAIHIRNN